MPGPGQAGVLVVDARVDDGHPGTFPRVSRQAAGASTQSTPQGQESGGLAAAGGRGQPDAPVRLRPFQAPASAEVGESGGGGETADPHVHPGQLAGGVPDQPPNVLSTGRLHAKDAAMLG
ncbi:MAG: hypothetical protein AB1445_09810 [Bacillota bacterium]